MKHFFISFLCVFFSCVLYGQNIIGIVQDDAENKIPLVNVQLLDQKTNKIISFTQTDSKGVFSLKTNNVSFPLKLKLQHLSFDNKELVLNSFEKLYVVLEPKTSQLKEIVIDAKAYDVIKRGDTLKYNLNSLLDGSELKLKDVVDKLPGLAIDEDGKIRYNGSIIDHLLFDGNEFLNKNHQIANENITAEMIQKIELLTNYQSLSSVKGFEDSGKTALNIGINEKFKHRFKGNVDTETGIKERYNLHGNVYNFGEKTMFNLVANTNNINYSVLSVNDYMDTRKTNGKRIVNEQFAQGRYSLSDMDLPSFLFAQDNVQSRKLTNYTLNFAHKFNANERIEFVSVFNLLDQAEHTLNKQTFFDGQSRNLYRTDQIEGKSQYASNVLKYEKKFKNNTYLNINAYSLWSKDDQNQFLESVFFSDTPTLIFDNRLRFKTNNFGINATYKNHLSKNWLLDAVVFYDNNNTNTDKDLNSTELFSWFNSPHSHLFQNTKTTNYNTGVLSRATWKSGTNKIVFRAYTGRDRERLNNYINVLPLYQLTDNYEKREHILGAEYQGVLTKSGLSYSLGLQYNATNHFFVPDSKKSIMAVLPNASVSYNLKNGFSAFVSYNSNLTGLSVYQFLTGNVIDDYRSYFTPSYLNPERMITDSYSVGLIRVFPEKNIFSSLSISHNNVRKKIEKTYHNTELVTEQRFQYLDVNATTSANITFNKKFHEIPYGIKFNSFGGISQLQTVLNNTISENVNYNASLRLNIQSYYKNSFVNFNAGVNYMNNTSKNEWNAVSNYAKLERITPFVTLTGVAFNKKLNWSLNTHYYLYEASSVRSQNIFDLGFKTQYNFSKNLQFYLNAQNVLNIRTDNTKNDFTTTLFYAQEIIMSTLSGFVNGGVIFSF